MIDRERVGAGLGINDQRRRVAAVHESRGTVIRGADLDATDVTDACHSSLAVGFDDDVGELLGRRQPPKRFDIDLIGLVSWHGGLIQDTGRDLQILGAQCGEHFAGAEIVCRDFVRIEPDAHGIFAAAQELDIAHALQAREHVLHMKFA